MLAVGVHFPKAGGNSLISALRRKYGGGLYLDYETDPALPDSKRQLEPADYVRTWSNVPHGATCVFGHFHPAKYQKADAVRFTVLRDPVDTMLSIYYYWQSQPPGGALHRHVLAERMPLLRMARMPILRRLMSYTYFGDYDMKQFDFIGRFEARDRTNAKLCELLGLEPFDDVHANKTPDSFERSEVLDSAAYRGSLYELLEDDVRFYERWAGC